MNNNSEPSLYSTINTTASISNTNPLSPNYPSMSPESLNPANTSYYNNQGYQPQFNSIPPNTYQYPYPQPNQLNNNLGVNGYPIPYNNQIAPNPNPDLNISQNGVPPGPYGPTTNLLNNNLQSQPMSIPPYNYSGKPPSAIKPMSLNNPSLPSAPPPHHLGKPSTIPDYKPPKPENLPLIPPKIPLGNPPLLPPKPMIGSSSNLSGSSLSEMRSQDHGTVGLRNLGNTCYMNSILQCLNATISLTRYFLSGSYKNDINRTNILGKGGRVAEEYQKFLHLVWSGQYAVITPSNIKSIISEFNSEFEGVEQHDSQEFLSCLLDGLHEDLNVARKKTKSEMDAIRERHKKEEREEESTNFDLRLLEDRAWKRYMDFNYSTIVTTFQGQYMSTLTCLNCKKSSSTFNSLMFLSVPIPDNATNLDDCLAKYIEKETLTGNNGWDCPSCKRKTDASKQLMLTRLPNILLIHLKRFYFQGPFRNKITKNINFPLKNLNLQQYTKNLGNNAVSNYNLFAISNHYGTLSGGHYTAFVRDNPNWISFDDSRVSPISESKIKTNAAYILFYERAK